MKAPNFWYKKSLVSIFLMPLGWIYGRIVQWRLNQKKPELSVPVICVGNLTMGGSGKTPVVLSLVEVLKNQGHVPHILTRGYGGKDWQSVQVDLKHHSSNDVGDEPILLASHAPTWVGRDRYASGQQAILAGATILVMDDGLQNPGLYQDVKIGVFDGEIPFVNKATFPAGPLREDFKKGLKRLDVMLLLNFSDKPIWADVKRSIYGQTITDQRPDCSSYVAFAGIGYPDKFFSLLKRTGFTVIKKFYFPDHHVYSTKDIVMLTETAKNLQAQLITTEKDLVKLSKNVKKNIQSLKIRLELDWTEIVNKALKKN